MHLCFKKSYADYKAQPRKSTLRFIVKSKWQRGLGKLIGTFNAYNALAIYGTVELGLDIWKYYACCLT
jgi:UDP-N-acetylmuramoyl-L-alanyl-D-glutamate--2,6-diaminopimelate ligase